MATTEGMSFDTVVNKQGLRIIGRHMQGMVCLLGVELVFSSQWRLIYCFFTLSFSLVLVCGSELSTCISLSTTKQRCLRTEVKSRAHSPRKPFRVNIDW